MKRKILQRTIIFAISAIVLVLSLRGVILAGFIGSAFGFALFFGFVLVSGGLFVWTIASLLTTFVLSTMARVLGSAWVAVRDERFEVTAVSFLPARIRHRFDPHNPSGLRLTIGIVVSLVFIVLFAIVGERVVLDQALTQIDIRIAALTPSLRTPDLTNLFKLIAALGDARFYIVTALIMMYVWRNQKWYLVALLEALVASWILVVVLNLLIGHLHPNDAYSLVPLSGSGFPSSHVFVGVVLYGLIAYALWRSLHSVWLRTVTVIGWFALIFMVALSQIYLGTDYFSGALASFLAGTSLLTALIVFVERLGNWHSPFTPPRISIHGTAWVVVLALYLVLIASYIPVHTVAVQSESSSVGSSVTQTVAAKLPHYSQTLSGLSMDPVNLIVIGSQAAIHRVFIQAGWYEASEPTATNLYKSFLIVIRNQSYPTGPVTPFFVNNRPIDMAFEQPTQTHSFRQRHHIRFWESGYKLSNGQMIWVATASFDESIKLGGKFRIPTHRTSPYIDTERNYVVSTLLREGAVYDGTVRMTSPGATTTAAGNTYYTDGLAKVIEVR